MKEILQNLNAKSEYCFLGYKNDHKARYIRFLGFTKMLEDSVVYLEVSDPVNKRFPLDDDLGIEIQQNITAFDAYETTAQLREYKEETLVQHSKTFTVKLSDSVDQSEEAEAITPDAQYFYNEMKELAEDLEAKKESDYWRGEKGDKGDQGIQGEQGIQGIQGEKGDKGDKGDTGNTYTITDADYDAIANKVDTKIDAERTSALEALETKEASLESDLESKESTLETALATKESSLETQLNKIVTDANTVIDNEQKTAVNAVKTQQTTSVNAVKSQETTSTNAVKTQGETSTKSVTDAETTALENIATEMGNLEAYAEEFQTDVSQLKEDLESLSERMTNAENSIVELFKEDFDGTKKTYNRLMKEWFLDNGAETATAEELTTLCDEWYTFTRTGWNGWTTFAQPDISTASTGTRGGDNADMVCVPSTADVKGQDDYEGLPQFACKDCNWILDDDGNIYITAIDGITSNFERANPDKYVGVLQMSMYHYWYEDDTSYTHGLRDNYLAEYEHIMPYPEAVRIDGTVRPWVCHSKYMSSTVDGKMTSCSGLIPTAFNSHDSLITLSAKNGTAYSGSCVIDWSFLVLMTLIKYNSLTLDGILQGCLNYNYQYYAKASEEGVNRVILNQSEAKNLIVGSSVIIGTYGSSVNRGTASNRTFTPNGAVITAIEDVEIDGTTYSAVYVNADTFDTTANGNAVSGSTIISTWHWVNGSCDSILGNDGYQVKGDKHAVRLQGIEFIVGGYEVMADVILNIADGHYQPYLANNRAYQATSVTSNMIAANLLSSQPVNDSSTSGAWQYIRKSGYEDGIFFPIDTNGGSSSTFSKDAMYKNYTGVKKTTREWLAFGLLGTGSGYGGLSCLTGGGYALSSSDWICLARLSPNGSRGEFVA